jgi:hypothetical protein
MPIFDQQSASRIAKAVLTVERMAQPIKPRKRKRPDPGGAVSGFSGTATVVTGITFDTDGCIAGYVTEDWEFLNGLLKAVT